MKAFVLTIFTILLLSNCSTGDKKVKVIDESKVDFTEIDLAEGFEILEANCFSCHSPNVKANTGIAPTMASIKTSYMKGNVQEDKFVVDMWDFLHEPTLEKSKMPEAVEKYNLMPKMSYNKNQISNIAHYLYQSSIEKEDWFDKVFPAEKEKYSVKSTTITPLEQGKQIAMKTKSVLGKNLLKALNTKGTDEALAFCSTKAIHLTDSMSTVLKAEVKRVSDNNRNPANSANENELAYIQMSKEKLKNGEEIKPLITSSDGKHVGYYPIMTNQMCLQCHGNITTDIKQSTINKIDENYPNDKATGYGENELRGIWVVEMEQ